VSAPNTSRIRSGASRIVSLNSDSAPDAIMIATMFRKLLVAISRPFSSPPARCCSSAFSGTAKKPPKKPIRVRLIAASVKDRPDAASAMANTPMPIAPIGASPSSTLSHRREHLRLQQRRLDRASRTELRGNRGKPSIGRVGALTRSGRTKRQRQADARRPVIRTEFQSAAETFDGLAGTPGLQKACAA
jgi:hypothetical protein